MFISIFTIMDSLLIFLYVTSLTSTFYISVFADIFYMPTALRFPNRTIPEARMAEGSCNKMLISLSFGVILSLK